MKLFSLLIFFISSLGHTKSFVPSSFSASYEESLVSVTGKLKKSFGKIDYKYPSHLRFEVTSPVASLVVINPEKTWYYRPPFIEGEYGEVTIQKSASIPLVKFLDTLKGGLENSKHFRFNYLKNKLVLTFNKKSQEELGIKEVTLHSKDDPKKIENIQGFEKITLGYSNKNITNIKLIDLKEGVSFSKNHFIFEIPEKTKVSTN